MTGLEHWTVNYNMVLPKLLLNFNTNVNRGGGGEGSCSFERGGTLPEKRQTQKHPVNVKMFFFPLENHHNYSTHNQMLNV